MNTRKPSRRKGGPHKLEPIDWHEFANDAVLNGNMSTLYRRPDSEDPTAYASAEALAEIEKRSNRPEQSAIVLPESAPTVGVDSASAGAAEPIADIALAVDPKPTVASIPTVASRFLESSGTTEPIPTPAILPTVGAGRKKVRPIRHLHDALTLAGQVLYRAMYGDPDDGRSKICSKGYRQLAAETHLDKDTVRDLICEFKAKAIVRQIGTYDPDTRSAKTYEVMSGRVILETWRGAGLAYVTTGRSRPAFCTAQGQPMAFKPAAGIIPTADFSPTVGFD
jgi:hypothetical protein